MLSFADADHGMCLDSYRSTSGQLILLNGAAVYWKSQLQNQAAISTTEAEYITLSENANTVVGLRFLMEGLQEPQLGPTFIFQDNTAAIAASKMLQIEAVFVTLMFAHIIFVISYELETYILFNAAVQINTLICAPKLWQLLSLLDTLTLHMANAQLTHHFFQYQHRNQLKAGEDSMVLSSFRCLPK